MDTDQNKSIKEKNDDVNSNNLNQNNILKQENEQIIPKMEKKEKKIYELNFEEEQQIKKHVLKTGKEEKLDENINNNENSSKENNLINNDKNTNLIDENNIENNNLNDLENKNKITENQENPNSSIKNIDSNNKKENPKEEIKITSENINNKVEATKNEEQINNPEIKQHKLTYKCLNECFKWTLNIDIKNKSQQQYPNDFKSNYEFQGSSVFFKKIEQSLINGLHNPQNLISSNYKNMPYKLILDSIKSESNKRIELSEQNNSLKELINYSFPIDNTKSNYFFINANLSMKENLNNIFLIEFDL